MPSFDAAVNIIGNIHKGLNPKPHPTLFQTWLPIHPAQLPKATKTPSLASAFA
jgi:hypothetical protein